jgi:DNA-binding NtrC family response regulator
VLSSFRIAAAAPALADRPQSFRRQPVLVVDDGGPSAHAIKRLLTAMQLPWEACTPGADMAEAVQRETACVVASFGGHGADGASLIEAVHRVAPGLAVIAVIDNPDVAATVDAMRLGAHAVIEADALAAGLHHQVVPLLKSI